MKYRTIAIVLGDNDFGMTFIPLLESIKNAFEWNEMHKCTEEQLDLFIRNGIKYHYLTFQLGHRLGSSGYGPLEKTDEYLQHIKVLFNEEAEAEIMTADHDGGSWYLELQSGVIKSY